MVAWRASLKPGRAHPRRLRDEEAYRPLVGRAKGAAANSTDPLVVALDVGEHADRKEILGGGRIHDEHDVGRVVAKGVHHMATAHRVHQLRLGMVDVQRGDRLGKRRLTEPLSEPLCPVDSMHVGLMSLEVLLHAVLLSVEGIGLMARIVPLAKVGRPRHTPVCRHRVHGWG
jgi:hypothetical protein